MSLMNKSIHLTTKLYQKKVPLLPKLMQRFNRLVFSTDIPKSVKIGEGTKFAHSGLGCVLHERTIIGSNCKILQNVTIGGNSRGGTPVIKDNVLIGAGATIIGNVTIGDNAKIGAMSLVLDDVPANTVIVANKGQTLEKNQ
ncbi:serine O-acetyltransferase [Staphylococcus haemolyticus]|uniref:serine O-acetyltransferase n=1 Tax=Staphylococcus haemolyticus TaxID=1283 RepID=UPI0034DDA3C5